MDRIEKLFRRLENLEDEYRILVIKEFEKKRDGYFSRYLSRKTSFNGKYWRDKDTAYLEKLEKDIIALRHKLSLPLLESPVVIVHKFLSQRKNMKDLFSGGETKLSKDMLEKLKLA